MSITLKQKNVLNIIIKYYNKNGFPPTIREICKISGLKSTSTVHGYITRLKNLGYLDNVSSCPRTNIPIQEKKSYIYSFNNIVLLTQSLILKGVKFNILNGSLIALFKGKEIYLKNYNDLLKLKKEVL